MHGPTRMRHDAQQRFPEPLNSFTLSAYHTDCDAPQRSARRQRLGAIESDAGELHRVIPEHFRAQSIQRVRTTECLSM